MTDEQVTGTAGGGVSFSRPLPEQTDDGARIVYVAVPNEDSFEIAHQRWAKDMELSPRIHAMNMAVSARQFKYQEDGIDAVIRDASKIEAYLNQGTVPALPEGIPAND